MANYDFSIKGLTGNSYIGNTINSLAHGDAEGTEPAYYLNPKPFTNRLGIIYSGIANAINGISNYNKDARADEIKMNVKNMDYTGKTKSWEESKAIYIEQAKNYDINGDGIVGYDDAAIFALLTSKLVNFTIENSYLNLSEEEANLLFVNKDYDSNGQQIYPIRENFFYYSYLTEEGNTDIIYPAIGNTYENEGGTVEYEDVYPIYSGSIYINGISKNEFENILQNRDVRIETKTSAKIRSAINSYGSTSYVSYEQFGYYLYLNDASNESILNLLMPQYKRRVEVEDLNKNFWVISTILDATLQALWKDSGLVDIIQSLVNRVIQVERILGVDSNVKIKINGPEYISLMRNFDFSDLGVSLITDLGGERKIENIFNSNSLPSTSPTTFRDYCESRYNNPTSSINPVHLFYSENGPMSDLVQKLTEIDIHKDNNNYAIPESCDILLYNPIDYKRYQENNKYYLKGQKDNYKNIEIINDSYCCILKTSDLLLNGEIIILSLGKKLIDGDEIFQTNLNGNGIYNSEQYFDKQLQLNPIFCQDSTYLNKNIWYVLKHCYRKSNDNNQDGEALYDDNIELETQGFIAKYYRPNTDEYFDEHFASASYQPSFSLQKGTSNNVIHNINKLTDVNGNNLFNNMVISSMNNYTLSSACSATYKEGTHEFEGFFNGGTVMGIVSNGITSVEKTTLKYKNENGDTATLSNLLTLGTSVKERDSAPTARTEIMDYWAEITNSTGVGDKNSLEKLCRKVTYDGYKKYGASFLIQGDTQKPNIIPILQGLSFKTVDALYSSTIDAIVIIPIYESENNFRKYQLGSEEQPLSITWDNLHGEGASYKTLSYIIPNNIYDNWIKQNLAGYFFIFYNRKGEGESWCFNNLTLYGYTEQSNGDNFVI